MAQSEMLVVARRLEDPYFRTRELARHMVEETTTEKEDDLVKCLDGYDIEKDPAPSGEDVVDVDDETNLMMTRNGLDGLEARPMELLTRFPPTLLRKRRQTGNNKYCLRETNGGKTNVTNTGPAVAPADRRKLNGRRRMVETNIMVEDGSIGPAKTMGPNDSLSKVL